MLVGTVDLTIIVTYFAVVILIGFVSMRRTKGFEDYAVAGRRLPVVFLFATMAATATGGAATIGRASQSYQSGIVIFVATVGFVLNQLLSGLFLAPRMRAIGKLYTVGDVMGFYYGRAARALTGIFSFLYSVSLFGVQLLAMGRILQTITGLPLVPLLIASSALVIFYTGLGGIWAVIYTDLLQFIVLAFGLTTASLVAIDRVGGVEAMTAGLDPVLLSFSGDWSSSRILGIFVAFLLGEALAPYFVQRYFATKSPRDTRWGVTLFGSYYGFYTIVVIALGLAGALLLRDTEPDLVLTSIVRDFLPIGLKGAVFAALLAAVMSTGDSILNNASVIFTRDLYQKLFRPDASDATMLAWSKTTTLLIGAGGVIAALSLPDVFELLIYSYTLWAPSIIPPLCVALLWGTPRERPVAPRAAVPAILAGIGATYAWGPSVLGEPFGVPAVAVGVGANLLVLFTVHRLTSCFAPAGAFVPEEVNEA
ncbi:MAG TPA: sodium:solute symporter family protein [Vicinamibacteria bacterium]|nr:sodium:solute symporter family protein [Vicinamibacteria bacterium]